MSSFDDDSLEFQDFSHSRGATRDSLGDLSPPIGGDGDAFGSGHVTLDDEPHAPAQGAMGGEAQYSIFNVRYYARFFNVDTPDVLSRIAFASLPLSDRFFEKLQRNPDLYGPVWISSTVVFMLAATGNFASYIEFASSRGMAAASYTWQFDFSKMTLGATIVYAYAFLVPLLAYAVLRYAGARGVGLTDVVCLYGYSLFIYIPVSIVCILPQPVVQWIAVALAALSSTAFVVRSLHRAMQRSDESTKRYTSVLLGGAALLSVALATTLKLFLFHNADLSQLIADDGGKLASVGMPRGSSAMSAMPVADVNAQPMAPAHALIAPLTAASRMAGANADAPHGSSDDKMPALTDDKEDAKGDEDDKKDTKEEDKKKKKKKKDKEKDA